MKLRNSYFLLRHGETVYQGKLEDRIYSWPDVPPVKITKKAEQKIKKVAKSLKEDLPPLKLRRASPPLLIYSSDFYRTRQTANIVAKELGLKVSYDKRLRDNSLGIFQDKSKAEFYKIFSNPAQRFRMRPKGGESWNDLKKRIGGFIKSTEKKHKNKKILIVSHGDPLWLFEGIIKGMTNRQLLDEIFKNHNYIKPAELRNLKVK